MSVATWFMKTPGVDLRVRAYLSQMLWRSQGELKMVLAKLALKIKAQGLSTVFAWSCLGVSTFSFLTWWMNPTSPASPHLHLSVHTLILRDLDVWHGGEVGRVGRLQLEGPYPRPLEEEMATHSSILSWKIPWQRSLMGYSSWRHKESDMTELSGMHPRPLIPTNFPCHLSLL